MTEMIADDIRRLEEQERLLRFGRFSPDDAWALGNRVRETALARGAGVAIDISLRDRTLFHCALPGTSTDNVEWIRRKRNTVLRLWHSSYLVGRRLALSGRDQGDAHNLPLADFAVHGGGFPLFAVNDGGDVLALTYTTDTFPNAAETSLSTDAGDSWLVGVATSATTGDVDFAEVAWNGLYGNLISVFLDDQLGTNHVYAGGFRPQMLTPMGTFAAGSPIHFMGERFGGTLPRGGVLISGAAGDGIALTDGRKTGLSPHPYFSSAVNFLGSALSGAMQPNGSFTTPTINLPGGIAAGTTLHFVGIEFLDKFSVGPITDVVTLVTQ